MLNEQEIIAWIESTATTEESARIEEELKSDPELRRRLLQQMQMDNALRVALGHSHSHERVKQSILTVVRGDEAALKQQVLADTTFLSLSSRREEAPSSNRLREMSLLTSAATRFLDLLRRPAWASGLAAACLCILIGGWILLRHSLRQEPQVLAIETPARVEFPQGTTVFSSSKNQYDDSVGSFIPETGDGLRVSSNGSGTISFADGTILHLEPETEVRFHPVTNPQRNGGKQLRLVSGSLSAIVAKQPENLPLLIETPHALITVVGTEFDLEVATNQTELEVTRGLVDLTQASSPKKLSVGAGEFAVASPNATPRFGQLLRNPFLWPFSSESPWNAPIGSGAKYEAVPRPFLADGPLANAVQTRKPFLGHAGDPLRNIWVKGQLRADVRLDENQIPKNTSRDSAVLMQRARRYVFELRNVTLRPDGGLDATDTERTDLTGPGVNAHAIPAIPFGLSNLGGLIRFGEYETGIRHALSARVNRERLSGRRNFNSPGTVWPATGGDAPVEGFLNIGTLLAIPPDVDVRKFVGDSGAGYELARTMQDYGVYITGFSKEPFTLVVGEARLEPEKETALLNQLVPLLQVVINNTEETPGGGGTPRRPLAPELPNNSE